MEKEWIFWIVLIVVIAAAALYFRFYSSQAIAMQVGIKDNMSSSIIYPFQKISLPITVSNTGGSSISRLTFEVVTNGNVTRTYQLTIPSGKQVVIKPEEIPGNK